MKIHIIFHRLINLLTQVMEARVKRLDLLMQQAERNLNDDPCCEILKCCLEGGQDTGNDYEPQYYFHK